MNDLRRLTIVCDTREQNPFTFFDKECDVVQGALDSGDYSILGFENKIAIERKSLGDLIGCLTSGRERFCRELDRLRGYETCAIVIESSWQAIMAGDYRSKLSPKSAEQSLVSIMQNYRMPMFFAENRNSAEDFAFDFLRHYHRHAIERLKSLLLN